MATAIASPTDGPHASDTGENPGTTFTFSRGLIYAMKLLFGSLALLGLLLVQGQLIIWFALVAVQIKSMALQARVLGYAFGTTIEEQKLAHKMNTIHIEITPPPQDTEPQCVEIIKKDFSFDENISLQIKTSTPKVIPPTASPSVNLPTPEVKVPVSNPSWQTKIVRQRKLGGGHAYAVKQVDVFAPGNNEHDSFLAPTSGVVAAPESFLGLTSAAAVTNVPSKAALSGEMLIPSFFSTSPTIQQPASPNMPISGDDVRLSEREARNLAEIARLKHLLERRPAAAAGTVPFEPDANGTAIPSFLSAFPTPQKPALTPKPVVRLPDMGMGMDNGNKPDAPKRELELHSPAPESERQPVRSAPKRVRRSMVKLVKPEITPVIPPSLPSSQLKPNDNLVDIDVEEPVKLNVSQDTSNVSSSGAGSTNLVDVEPAEMNQLRHVFFFETSILDETPAENPQEELLLDILPISSEDAAREALGNAFNERESARVELSKSYSEECVDRFSGKAQEYKVRRRALEFLMPSRELSSKDKAAFPFLSGKDTGEPEVASPTVSEPQHSLPVLSPASTSEGEDEDKDEQHIIREDPLVLLARASRAYQLLLGFTKNMEIECPVCNSEFCLKSYSPAAQRKMKSAKELYQLSRSRVMDDYEPRQVPESLTKQLPEVEGC